MPLVMSINWLVLLESSLKQGHLKSTTTKQTTEENGVESLQILHFRETSLLGHLCELKITGKLSAATLEE